MSTIPLANMDGRQLCPFSHQAEVIREVGRFISDNGN